VNVAPTAKRPALTGPPDHSAFDAEVFLRLDGTARSLSHFERGDVIFTQGDPSDQVFYLQHGGVKVSVLSTNGKEAIVAMLKPGAFFGEACLTGQAVRTASATALTSSTVLRIGRTTMQSLLHSQHGLTDKFISHMLSRNIRIEEDLVDQLFNSSEKRLARALLLLAHYGEEKLPLVVMPRVSQETLAEMVGTTRSRVNFFLNKFKRLGYIDYDDDRPLMVHNSLLSVLLHD